MNEATEAESITEDKEAERKRLAAERRKKVMDQMKNAQKNFMKENKQLYDDTVQKRQRLNTEGNQDDSNQEMMEDVVQCLGKENKMRIHHFYPDQKSYLKDIKFRNITSMAPPISNFIGGL